MLRKAPRRARAEAVNPLLVCRFAALRMLPHSYNSRSPQRRAIIDSRENRCYTGVRKARRAANKVSQGNFELGISHLALPREVVRSCRLRVLIGFVAVSLVAQTAFASTEDWRMDTPGRTHHISASDLSAPYATRSSNNAVHIVSRPDGATLAVPLGFTVAAFATGLEGPRRVQVAPNGDIFITETLAGRVRVVQSADGAAKPSRIENFAVGLNGPFGIAFYPASQNPEWIYIATIDRVLRFAYRRGDLR